MTSPSIGPNTIQNKMNNTISMTMTTQTAFPVSIAKLLQQKRFLFQSLPTLFQHLDQTYARTGVGSHIL